MSVRTNEMPNEAPPGPDPMIGTNIGGRYRIVNKLGEGGMGSVYTAEQQMGTTVRKVAVKTLHPHLSHDPKILARFERECGTVAELQHPNTIQVYDFGKTEDGTLYIVMEFVEGRSVADILEKDGPMPPARVKRILSQVVGSLEEAHQRGIIHRDLKPDNVVLCDKAGQKDWVEVLDFGIAKRSSEHDPNEAKLTQQGMVLGTPPYMSPEQFTGNPVDARSDIYALGVMAYEMLSGRLPFSGNTAWEWATAHMTVAPIAIENTPAGANVPPAMREAIRKALSKQPGDRFASANAFFEAFSSETPAAASGGRTGTQVGAPLEIPQGAFARTEAGGMPLAPGYGAGAPVAQPGTPAAGNHAVPAMHAAPAPSGKQGGGKGAILAVIGVLAVLSIGAIVVAMKGSGGGSKTANPGLDVNGLGTSAPPTAITSEIHTPPVPMTPPVAATIAPLATLEKPTYVPPPVVKPSTPATAKPAATPAKPATPSAETQNACAAAASQKGKNPSVYFLMREKCIAGGGTAP
ncbi:MAG: protein kinase [Polyangiaceae bacterium]